MWHFLSQMLQLIVHQLSVLFHNQTGLPFSDSFTQAVTQHNHWCTDINTTEYKQMEEHLVLPTEVLPL
jgi:imidazoleglycerol phosphate dehydratase HisB